MNNLSLLAYLPDLLVVFAALKLKIYHRHQIAIDFQWPAQLAKPAAK
jgi:hypothetical protein